MAMFVNTNVSSLNGQRNLQNVTDRMNSSFEKLSSGSRINSAKDDAAGLQISDRLTTQITGLSQGNRNANDGISIAQIAEGALGEITSNVQRMRQLVVQGGNRTLSSDDRSALGEEFTKLFNVNNDIADRTAYGTIKILNQDSNEAGFQVQSGAHSGQQDTVTTGNAELSALFGKSVIADGVAGTTKLSAMSTANIGNYGDMGKMVAAYMVVTGESRVSAANQSLFGFTTGQSTTLADFGSRRGAGAEIKISGLAEILKADAPRMSAGAALGNASNIAQGMGNIALGLGFTAAGANIDSASGFSDAQLNALNGFATDTLMDVMSGLVTEVDKQRAKLGAEQNGLASTVRSNTAAIVNVSDSRARIMDTDFASETAELTRNQIIQQAATSILSQANQLPNSALSLLR